jgi:CRP/FNR family cyclic AMP-dependent transcriptional regulator
VQRGRLDGHQRGGGQREDPWRRRVQQGQAEHQQEKQRKLDLAQLHDHVHEATRRVLDIAPSSRQDGAMAVSETQAEVEQGSFLEALEATEAGWLHERGVARRFERGAALFHERQLSDRVMILLEGRVKIASASEDGREAVLAFRGPGEVLGELSAIDGQPRSASVIAVDPVRALVVPAGDFRHFLERTPRATLWLLTRVISRLREADRKRVEFGTSDTIGRVAARLVELAERYGRPSEHGVRIDLPITQEELASWVGSSREGVNKALHTLRGLHWVETERRSLTVLDLEALRRRAG